MCRPDDYPPYPHPTGDCGIAFAHSDEDHGGPLRLYDVTYAVNAPGLRLRRRRVWAATTDEARARARALDPEYLNTTRTPRIVR